MKIQSLMFTVDTNHDGTYNMRELWEVGKAIYRLPGNLLVEGLGNLPYAAQFLNIQASASNGYASLNGTLAVAVSLIFWVSLVFTVLTIASPTDPNALPDAAANLSPQNSKQHTLHNQHVHAALLHQHAAAPRRGLAGKAATVSRDRMHLPVSRSYYAAPGRKPVRKRHRLRLAH